MNNYNRRHGFQQQNTVSKVLAVKNRRLNQQSGLGLIGWIFLIVIIISVLSYFGVNIQRGFTSPTAESNFSYIWGLVTYVWYHFLQSPATYIWNTFIVGILWNILLNPLLHSLQTAAANSNHS
jgi:hypothetical protein